MPQIDMTITISVIVALAAIVSPILTAIINNRYQLKLKKLELKQKEYEQTVLYKRKIFENSLVQKFRPQYVFFRNNQIYAEIL